LELKGKKPLFNPKVLWGERKGEMFADIKTMAGEILTFLEERHGQVSVREIRDRVGGSIYLIHLSIAALVREHLVGIETKDGENFVVRVSKDLSSTVAERV